MAPPSNPSSARKAAKVTQRGRTKSVRFQGGTLFPLIVALVVILGLGTVVYARQSIPAPDTTSPTINDHWHAVYGFYICGEWYTLGGDLETVDSQGRLTSTPYLQTGVHSHDDGVIHWHPFTSKAVGRRANIGLFLDVYSIELDEERLAFPTGQPIEAVENTEFIVGETTCDGEPAELSVVVWPNAEDTGSGTRYIANFEDIRVENDGMVFVIAFMPRGEDVPIPPWAADLERLGAADAGGITSPEDLIEQGILPEDFDLSQLGTVPTPSTEDTVTGDSTGTDQGTGSGDGTGTDTGTDQGSGESGSEGESGTD